MITRPIASPIALPLCHAITALTSLTPRAWQYRATGWRLDFSYPIKFSSPVRF